MYLYKYTHILYFENIYSIDIYIFIFLYFILYTNRDATITDFVGTIIVWGIITVSRCNAVDMYGKKEAGTGEHLNILITK